MSTTDIISNFYIILLNLAWLGTLVVYQRKKGYVDAGTIVLSSYLLYALFSLLLFNSPFYFFDNIELFPFIYLFLMQLLFFTPILRYDTNKIDEIQKPSSIILFVVNIVLIIASLMQLPKIVSEFALSIIKLLTISSGGQELYNDAMADSISLGDGSISNLPSIITNAYGNFGILLFFFYLTLNKRNILITIGLFLSCIINILNNISLGQRGPIMEIVLALIITYFALKKFFQPSVKKVINIIGIVLLAATLIPIIALTNSRFSESKEGSNATVYFYVGQENLFFNNYGLDNGGIRYADRTFPLFKKMLGFQNVPDNFWERRNKYPNLIINDEMFINFVGDFTLDFGPFLPPLIFIVFTIFVLNKTIVNNGVMLFHQFILLHFVMSVVMLGGMKLYPFSDVGGNLQLIVYIIAYQFFRLEYLYRLNRDQQLINVPV